MCLDKIKFKKVKLVLIAEDASENTKEKFSKICESNNIPFYIFGNKFDLSRSIGKDNKTVFAILDGNFSKSIIKMLEDLRGATI